MHISYTFKIAAKIFFFEQGDRYKFKFLYSICLNSGVMNAADVQEVSCHTLCCMIDG